MSDAKTVPRNSWRAALGVVVGSMTLLTPVFYWYARTHVSELDRVALQTVSASVELAYVLALVLLGARRESAAGFAAGFAFGAAAVFLVGAFLWVSLEAAFDHHGDLAFRSICGLYAIASIAVLIVAVLARGRIGWFAVGVVGAPMGLALLGSAVSPAFTVPYEAMDRARTQARIQESEAKKAVFGLTACILREREAKGAFPSTLAGLSPSESCNGVRKLSGYTLVYSVAADSTDNFLLLAKPDASTIDDRAGVVMSDHRGMVFVEHDFPSTSARTDRGTYVFGSSDGIGLIYGVRNAVRGFMDKHDARSAPQSLDDIAAADPDSGRYFTLVANNNAYQVGYVAPNPDAPAMFAVSSTCRQYGVLCIRSYRLSPDGRVHATGAPRPATDADPLILEGENSDGVVNSGIVWR